MADPPSNATNGAPAPFGELPRDPNRDPSDYERKLTRATAAAILNVSPSTLRRAEARGIIPHAIDPDGVHRFSVAELQHYGAGLAGTPRTRVHEGERDARAFRMFEQGATPQAVTMELRVPFGEAERLQREWSRSSPVAFSARQLEELASLGVDVSSAASVIAAVRRLRERLREARATPDRRTPPGPESPG